jgi:SAM-dependent methyltransferase
VQSLKSEWEHNAKVDPFWSIMSIDHFHTDGMDERAIRKFYDTGHDHIAGVIQHLGNRLGFAVRPDAKAFDFGCGAGRCTAALLSYFHDVVGYDVSPSMVQLAETHIATARRNTTNNVKLISDPTLLEREQGTFDFVHSEIVFQHIPPEEGYVELNRLLRALRDGGAGFINISIARDLANRDMLVNTSAAKDLYIRMFGYSFDRVMAIFSSFNIIDVEIRLHDMGDKIFGANFFFKKP